MLLPWAEINRNEPSIIVCLVSETHYLVEIPKKEDILNNYDTPILEYKYSSK